MEPTLAAPAAGEDCGSYAGWMRHRAAGQRLDQACADYREAWCAARRGPRPYYGRLDLAPCGTEAACRRHYRRRELPLDASCKQAERRKNRDQYWARKAAA